MLIDSFEGKPLNAPNDVVVASDGAVWFTDPGYGIDGPYEGHKAEAELPRNVYRLDPASGAASVVADDFVRPNGLVLLAGRAATLHRRFRHLAWRSGAYPGLRGGGARLRNGRVFADDSHPA